MPPFSDAAQNAAAIIVKACRELQNSLSRTVHPNFANLLFEFNRDTESAINDIENYGTDIQFASVTEWFITAANFWNKYVYACLRNGNGEIRHVNGSKKSNVNVVLYAGEFTQEFDTFEQTMSNFESSPLRSLQSIQYVLEYYQALLTELQSSFSYLSLAVGFYNARPIYAKRLDDLRYKLRQLEFGFETDAAWEAKRSLSAVALRWREEEARIAFEREEERKRTERIQEQRRLQAKQAIEEEARRAREEEQREEQEKRSLRALEAARQRTLQEAKMENANLRRKIRNESRQSGLLLEYEGWDSRSDWVSAVEPWAIFYEDDQIDNSLSAMFESHRSFPWTQEPRRQSYFGTIHFEPTTDIEEYDDAFVQPRATTPNLLFPFAPIPDTLSPPRPKSAA